MIRIIKNGEVTNAGPDQEWLDKHIAMGTFGSAPIYSSEQVLVTPEVRGPVDELISVATYNEYGEEIDPAMYITNPDGLISAAVYETVTSLVYAGDYTVEIVDDSAQKAQEAVNSEALSFLAQTDWLVIRAMERGEELSSEFKAERDAARARIVI
jgi:hypothetical protein